MFLDPLRPPRFDDPRTVTVLGTVAAAVVLVPLGEGPLVGTVVGLVGAGLMLLCGQALRVALQPSPAADRGPAARMERAAWTLALSLVVPVLGAFVLDVGPTGLDRTGWAVLLGVVTVGAGGVAWARHGRPGPRPRRRPLGARAVLTIAATVVITGAALWVGVSSAVAVPDPSFTELSLVPRDTTAGPGTSAADRSGGPLVTVSSSEDRVHRYRLELQTGTRGTVQVVALELAPGQQWRQDAPGPVSHAVLYRDGEPTPYREVWLGRP